jgi:hypothetical protein
MIKHSDFDTPLCDLRKLFEMINQKADSDKFICAMRQYIVNPLAWFETENIAKATDNQRLKSEIDAIVDNFSGPLTGEDAREIMKILRHIQQEK